MIWLYVFIGGVIFTLAALQVITAYQIAMALVIVCGVTAILAAAKYINWRFER
ncbi:hypothetical protein [Salinicoccus albus]|uniref:hypothetical protein n=1 Tax=Salinicoccus albus TaxID=418756 RepID=UPI00035D7749|nr:hypothetical protein [Salinicoccus albus]